MHILNSLFLFFFHHRANLPPSHIYDKRFCGGKDANAKLGSTQSKDKTQLGLVMPLACIRSHRLWRGLFCPLLQRPTGGVPAVHHTAAAHTSSNHLPGVDGALGGGGPSGSQGHHGEWGHFISLSSFISCSIFCVTFYYFPLF